MPRAHSKFDKYGIPLPFWDNVMPVTESGCWLWLGHVNRKTGYGKVFKPAPAKPRDVRAHRYFYEKLKGQIPEGMTLDHLCKVRCCVNPDHLEIVTLGENCLRGESGAAKNARMTHCKNGHELPPYEKYKHRTCKICKSNNGAIYYQTVVKPKEQLRRLYGR